MVLIIFGSQLVDYGWNIVAAVGPIYLAATVAAQTIIVMRYGYLAGVHTIIRTLTVVAMATSLVWFLPQLTPMFELDHTIWMLDPTTLNLLIKMAMVTSIAFVVAQLILTVVLHLMQDHPFWAKTTIAMILVHGINSLVYYPMVFGTTNDTVILMVMSLCIKTILGLMFLPLVYAYTAWRVHPQTELVQPCTPVLTPIDNQASKLM
jgi:hypothetical protein